MGNGAGARRNAGISERRDRRQLEGAPAGGEHYGMGISFPADDTGGDRNALRHVKFPAVKREH